MADSSCWISMAFMWLSGFLLRPLIVVLLKEVAKQLVKKEHVDG